MSEELEHPLGHRPIISESLKQKYTDKVDAILVKVLEESFINNEDFYEFDRPDKKERTMKRLTQIFMMGMKETGIASFGMPNVMDGLYIEKVWSYSDKAWDDYINWVVELTKEKLK